MKHIILTRFNLQYEADSHPGIEENWLATRMQLFEHYCLPSVQKQTVQDFIWVLLCDCDTPDVYKKRL